MPTTIQPPENAAAPEVATTAFALQASLGTALDAALGNTWAATPGQSTAQLLSSGQAVLDTAQLQTPGQLTPGQLTPGQLTPGKLTPGQLTPAGQISGQIWGNSSAQQPQAGPSAAPALVEGARPSGNSGNRGY